VAYRFFSTSHFLSLLRIFGIVEILFGWEWWEGVQVVACVGLLSPYRYRGGGDGGGVSSPRRCYYDAAGTAFSPLTGFLLMRIRWRPGPGGGCGCGDSTAAGRWRSWCGGAAVANLCGQGDRPVRCPVDLVFLLFQNCLPRADLGLQHSFALS
jgi:hypothetical protein